MNKTHAKVKANELSCENKSIASFLRRQGSASEAGEEVTRRRMAVEGRAARI